MIDKILSVRKAVWERSPMIHCITNPISINDCANYVLSAGAKPFMAEHPNEVEEITKTASALALNIANITDARMESIKISAKTAEANDILSIIDIVGVGCSRLRLDYVKKLLEDTRISAIKGNIAEIKALLGLKTKTIGIDVAEKPCFSEDLRAVMQLAEKYHCVVLASGERDIISDGRTYYATANGRKEMSLITGTGCILNVLCAVYMSVSDPLTACTAAAVLFGISGELADVSMGMASYRINMLDKFYTLSDDEIRQKAVLVTDI